MPKVASTRRPQTKPKMGQHFLASEDLASRVVDALGDVSQSTVLEIGPGRGIMTGLLARRARRLIAVELDRVMAAQLRLKFGMARNVEVIEADVRTAGSAEACAEPPSCNPASDVEETAMKSRRLQECCGSSWSATARLLPKSPGVAAALRYARMCG